MARGIKHFSESGVALDQETILRIKKEVEDNIVDGMRKKGWVPVIDLLPQLFWDYNSKQENFNFEITIYGTFVGKKKAQQEILGILDSRPIFMEIE